MKNRLNNKLKLYGLDLHVFKNRLKYLNKVSKDSRNFKKLGGQVDKLFKITSDFTESAGTATGHYFHQDLLVAQNIFQAEPENHLDVGSRIDGLVAHVASFRKITVLDIRPMSISAHPNINFIQSDLMDENAGEKFLEKYDSISCLHAIEHFGLGRYGDPLSPNGHLVGFENIISMLRPGGTLYISFPISFNPRIEFNAHRVFHPEDIFNWPKVKTNFSLVNFDLVNDEGHLVKNLSLEEIPENIIYGCGIYTLKRIQ